MTPADLRESLTALSLTATAFAAHLHRTPRTVRRWLSGETPIPRLVEREVDTMTGQMLYLAMGGDEGKSERS